MTVHAVLVAGKGSTTGTLVHNSGNKKLYGHSGKHGLEGDFNFVGGEKERPLTNKPRDM
ncbi:MAG: hypothetical protein QX199_14380 [Methylococcaceae bacterium]